MAQTLGYPHPDHLLAELSHRQFEEWVDYYNLEPWGAQRDDARTAQLTWAALQPHSKKKLSPEKFMPRFGEPADKSATWEDLKRKCMRANLANGGTFVTKTD